MCTTVGITASEFVGYQPVGLAVLVSLSKRGSRSVPLLFAYDVLALENQWLVHGTPEIVALAVDREKYFFEIKGFA